MAKHVACCLKLAKDEDLIKEVAKADGSILQYAVDLCRHPSSAVVLRGQRAAPVAPNNRWGPIVTCHYGPKIAEGSCHDFAFAEHPRS